MSRINDALKRAKAAQENRLPHTDGLRLRPAEPARAATWGARFATLFVVVMGVLLGLFLVGHVRQKLAARSRPPGESGTVTPANDAQTTPAAVSPRAAGSTLQGSLHRPATATPEAATMFTNATTSATVPLDIPAFTVQAILFSVQSPLAMIDGRTVKIGDTIGDEENGYRVAAISERTVTLVKGTDTNVLKLNR